MENAPQTREFLAQRDLKIWQMRGSGMSHSDIGKALDLSIRAVSAALSRQARKLNREAAYDYPEVMRLELERLDKLQASIWPLAQHRKITLGDGSEVVVEPDLKAVETLLKISQDRRKLLGLDAPQRLDISQDVKHTLHGATSSEAIDYRNETMSFLRLMIESRIIDEETGAAMLAGLEGETVDVEEVEDVEGMLELSPPGDD